MKRKAAIRGFTLIELLIGSSLAGLVIFVMVALGLRIMVSAGLYYDEGRIISEARVQMERMAASIRGASSVDEWWLTEGGSYQITYRREDGEEEGYRLEDSNLIKTMGGRDIVVARNLLNIETDEPLFTYYSLGGGQAVQINPQTSGAQYVDRVAIRYVFGSSSERVLRLDTMVTPRRVK